jgi:hypothetical protein
MIWEVYIDPNVDEELVVTGVVWNSFRDNVGHLLDHL